MSNAVAKAKKNCTCLKCQERFESPDKVRIRFCKECRVKNKTEFHNPPADRYIGVTIVFSKVKVNEY